MVGSAESHRFTHKIAAVLGAVALMVLIGSLRPNLFWPIRLIPHLLPGNPTNSNVVAVIGEWVVTEGTSTKDTSTVLEFTPLGVLRAKQVTMLSWKSQRGSPQRSVSEKTTSFFSGGKEMAFEVKAGGETDATLRWEANDGVLKVLPSVDGTIPVFEGFYKPDFRPKSLDFEVTFRDNNMTLDPRFENFTIGTAPEPGLLWGKRSYVLRRSRSGIAVWFGELVGRPHF